MAMIDDVGQSIISRRQLLQLVTAVPAALVLPGCLAAQDDGVRDDLGSGGGVIVDPTCMTREEYDVSWRPSAAAPCWYGVHDLGPADGAPRPTMIYYPAPLLSDRPAVEGGIARVIVSDDVAAMDHSPPPIVETCFPYPIVVFLHGHPRFQTPIAGQHKLWRRLPAAIARCGFVVVVPNHRAEHYPSEQDSAAVMQDIAWVRTNWVHASQVDQSPAAIAVGGHSNGGRLAYRVSHELENCAATFSLSSPYLSDNSDFMQRPFPRLMMWAENLSSENQEIIWNSHRGPKHLVKFQGQHFDYLDAQDTGIEPRGPCPHIGQLAADIIAMFLSYHMKPNTGLAAALRRPDLPLTDAQKRYLVQHLPTLEEGVFRLGCRATLKWEVPSDASSRVLF